MSAPRKRAKRLTKAQRDDPDQYLPLLARAAAERARRPTKPLTRSEALAAAPWSPEMPAAWERAFRAAYADRLEELGRALPAKPSGTSGRSGVNLQARRTLRASEQEFADHDAKAKAAGLDWTTWARRKLAT